MIRQYPQRHRPHRERPLHILPLPQTQHRPAHYPRHARRLHHRQRYHYILKARPKQRHQRYRQQKRRERHQPVHKPHYDIVRQLIVARHYPDGYPAHNRGERYAQAYRKRQAAAVNRARKHIPAHAVRPEKRRRGRRLQPVHRIQRLRIYPRYQRREYRHQNRKPDDSQPKRHIRILPHQPAKRRKPLAVALNRAPPRQCLVRALLSLCDHPFILSPSSCHSPRPLRPR